MCPLEVIFNKNTCFHRSRNQGDILPDAKYVCSNHAFLYLAQGGFGEPDVCYVKPDLCSHSIDLPMDPIKKNQGVERQSQATVY